MGGRLRRFLNLSLTIKCRDVLSTGSIMCKGKAGEIQKETGMSPFSFLNFPSAQCLKFYH